jgi:protein-tyrosine kinase
MSRIDEALKQAGIKKFGMPPAAETELAGLDSFPVGPQTDAAPEPLAAATRFPEPAKLSEPANVSEPAKIPEPIIAMQASIPVEAERLVVHGNADPVVIEQYRHLAAVLHQAQVDRGIKIVLVGSAEAAEGKTLTAANLALTLSESYRRRVLLIDADLRRPSLGKLFAVPPASGLSECLRSETPQPLRVTTLSASLGLLPAGRADHDPMAGLTSGRMQQILNQAAASFDWVVIDTPPVGLLTDAHLLSAMVDAAVLVIDAGVTQCAVVQRAIESIGREKIVGVVLNRIEDEALEDAAYYQYYHYPRSRRRRGYLGSRSNSAMVPDVPEMTR